MSQFLVLIYDNEAEFANGGPDAATRIMEGHAKLGEKYADSIVNGNALQPVSTATSVRPDNNGGFSLTDGPFAETKEALGGYYLIEAADLDAAIAFAKEIPVVSGGLEVRPIMVFDR
jgi:hypothetical protein